MSWISVCNHFHTMCFLVSSFLNSCCFMVVKRLSQNLLNSRAHECVPIFNKYFYMWSLIKILHKPLWPPFAVHRVSESHLRYTFFFLSVSRYVQPTKWVVWVRGRLYYWLLFLYVPAFLVVYQKYSNNITSLWIAL